MQLITEASLKEKKELDITLQKYINTYLHTSLPLCTILNNDNLMPWFNENFIEIYYTDIHKCIQYKGCDFDFENNFNDILEKLPYSYDLLTTFSCLIEFLLDNINKGYYAYIYLDEFYLPAKNSFNIRHFVHDSLIYGYNKNSRKFLAIAFDKDMVFSKMEYDFDHLVKAFNKGKPAFNYNYPLILFKIKKGLEKKKYNFSLQRFTGNIENYIKSYRSYEITYFNSFFRNYDYDENNIYYGFDVYKPLLKIFKNNSDNLLFQDFRNLHFLLEHKKGLYARFKYITQNYEVTDEFFPLINNFQSVIDYYGIIRNLIIKYSNSYNHSKIDIADRIHKLLSIAICKEKEVIIQLYNQLKKICILNMPKILQPNIAINASISTKLCDPHKLSHLQDNDNESISNSIILTWQQSHFVNKVRLVNPRGIRGSGVISFSDNSVINVIGGLEQYLEFSFEPREITWLRYEQEDCTSVIIEVYEVSLSWKKPASASTILEKSSGVISELYTADKALDGCIDTCWVAKNNTGTGEYLEINFQEFTAFNCIIFQQHPYGKISGYKIEYSNDRKSWNELHSSSGTVIGDKPIPHFFDTVSAIKIRILITETIVDGSSYSQPGLTSLEVYYFNTLPK